MGHVRTPTFRVEFFGVRDIETGKTWSLTPSGWDSKYAGRPSDETLLRYVRRFEESTAPGEVNEQLGNLRVNRAQVIRQSNDELVAIYAAPLFEVLS